MPRWAIGDLSEVFSGRVTTNRGSVGREAEKTDDGVRRPRVSRIDVSEVEAMYPSGDMLWMAFWYSVGLVFVAGMLWLLFVAFRGSSRAKETAEEILRRRLAAGEIDTEEYERRLAVLSKTKRAA